MNEVPEHPEGRAARSENDPGPELDDLGPELGQHAPGLVATGEMGGEVVPRVAETAQVDDPPDPRLFRRPPEVAGGRPVALPEPPLPLPHGVDQVVGHIDAGQGRGQGFGLEHVHPLRLHVRPAASEPLRVAAGGADGQTSGAQALDEPGADVPARPRHEGHRGHAPDPTGTSPESPRPGYE